MTISMLNAIPGVYKFGLDVAMRVGTAPPIIGSSNVSASFDIPNGLLIGSTIGMGKKIAKQFTDIITVAAPTPKVVVLEYHPLVDLSFTYQLGGPTPPPIQMDASFSITSFEFTPPKGRNQGN